MGGISGITLCGSCNVSNKNEQANKSHEELIEETIKNKTEILLLKIAYLEKQIEDTKQDIKENKSDIQHLIRDLKSDLMTLINFMNDNR